MAPKALMGWVIAAGGASLVAMLLSARAGAIVPSAASAALFAFSIMAAAILVNRPSTADISKTGVPDEGVRIAQYNARLMALAYAWGSAVLLLVYPLTALKWYHPYQYGSAMALVAAGLFAYSVAIGSEGSALRTREALMRVMALAVIQGLATIAVLVFLVGSGKLGSTRGDWLANQVFALGGLAVACLSVIAAMTQRKLLH